MTEVQHEYGHAGLLRCSACLGKIVWRSTQVQGVGAVTTAKRLVTELNAVHDQTAPAQLMMR